MQINADFAQRAAVHAADCEWIPSPMPGVERKMLDRVGDEVARATSLVRYAAGSHFSPHTHGGGEEFLVLDGLFQDETGDAPAGTYVRNPPGTRHTPASAPGCTIFVKLWQFAPGDRRPVRLALSDLPPRAVAPGIEAAAIFSNGEETVTAERWAPDRQRLLENSSGLEVLVLSGGFTEGGEAFAPHDWLRLPPGAALDAKAGPRGCRLWLKTGHLRHPRGLTAAS